jgi:hypothetical protein
MSTVSWRRTIPTLLVATSWLALGAALLAEGCFNPKIPSGSFRCGMPPNKLCPDGQTCVTGLCVDSNGADAGGQGGAGGACANAIAPLCSPMGALSVPCDPVCQTGCPCGQRCSLTADAIKCVAQSGMKGSGEPCTPDSNECAPGFACRREACGTNLGRCYRLCSSGSDCGPPSVCGIDLHNVAATNAGLKGCNLGEPVPACDPALAAGCSPTELACYLTNQQITCDCPGAMPSESPCIFSTDCAPGLTCASVSGHYLCKPVCKAGTICPDATSSCIVDMPLPFAYGHCP